jgi:hypothetical protein
MYDTTTGSRPSTAGTERSESTADQAKEKVQETAQQAAGQARGQLRQQVDQRSTEAGERVGTVAGDVRSVGEELRKQGKEQPAKLADKAASQAEKVGDYLKRSDGDTILRDVEDFGRQRPWAVMAGGVALGVLASRFLKASSTRRYETAFETSRTPPAREGRFTPSPVAPAPTTAPGDVSLSGGVMPARPVGERR